MKKELRNPKGHGQGHGLGHKHSHTHVEVTESMQFALCGNPNSGKTTLFNALTGSSAEVGNWAGVTVDKKVGKYKLGKVKHEIIDLPGIYSLSPYTPEEIITRNFILGEQPDCVINIVDATNLERNLYLTSQILEMNIPVVVALNMIDVSEKNGDKIDIEGLEKALGVPVVAISALTGQGIKELMVRSSELGLTKREGKLNLEDESLITVIKKVEKLLIEKNIQNPLFHAVKLVEGDEYEEKGHNELIPIVEKIKSERPLDDFDGDFEGIVADKRYSYISDHLKKYLKKKVSLHNLSKSDKIDRVLTHRVWGIPIFLAIMFLVFHLTFSENLFYFGTFIPEGSFDIPIIGTDGINSPGMMLFSAVELLTEFLSGAAATLLESAPMWVSGLIVDGILSGVFAVLSFIPQILTLFLFLSILQNSGYMARVAFIMDRVMRKFGLSGKAFLPLLSCFGCAVPGIMGTRTLENEKERRLAIMLTPFFSCGAKLPIWATFAAILFGGQYGDLIVFAIYILGIIVAFIAALLLNLTVLKGETPPFIMELPSYHRPQFRATMFQLWDKLKHYLVRASTIIAGAIVVIWTLTNFNFSWQMVDDMSTSILGEIAKSINFIFVPLGFGMGDSGWKFVLAAFTGLIAKEMVVATMGTLSGFSGDALETESGELAGTPIALMISTISVPAAFAFMAFNLLSVPCMAAVSVAKSELSSKKKFWATIAFWMATAYIVSLAVYWIGTIWWISIIVAAVLAITITLLMIKRRREEKMTQMIK